VKPKIEKVDPTAPDPELIKRAATLIGRGDVVVCPTDTGYAFSANALDTRAIARVFHLKGRSFSNPIHVAVASMEEADKYAFVDELARHLAARYLPGALTLVLRRRQNVPAMLVAGLDTIGIRVPDNRVMLALVGVVGKPLTTTSANISGRPTPYSAEEVVGLLGENVRDVALVLDQGPLKNRELSTIIDLTADPPQLIRQGRVSWLEVREHINRLLHRH
jgi:L-threonylcarbamoyladenylate synthase